MLQDLHVVKEYAARPVIKANPDGILHVFVNILTNAIHAMNGRGILTLAIEWADDKARVAITTKPPEKGTGLGLHNVLTIVKALQGRVSLESEVGRGSSFRVAFPKA